MPRASDILVVLTYAMIAVVAALAFERFGLMSSQMAWIMGAVVFLIAGQVHAAAARAEERTQLQSSIHELRAANLSLLEELETTQTRLEDLEGKIEASSSPVSPLTFQESDQPLEIPRMGSGYEASASEHTLPENRSDDRLIAELIQRLETGGAGLAANIADESEAALIRDAIDSNRVDLYLQPMVSLPQRRTYFYEGFTRLRNVAGEVVPPGAFLKAAEDAGLITEVDNLLLFRCVQIVRKLTKSDRRIGIFCNVSMRSLSDEDFFPAFLDFLRRNADLSGSLVFEMTQAGFESRSATAARNMARLADYGFRFFHRSGSQSEFGLGGVATCQCSLCENRRHAPG